MLLPEKLAYRTSLFVIRLELGLRKFGLLLDFHANIVSIHHRDYCIFLGHATNCNNWAITISLLSYST